MSVWRRVLSERRVVVVPLLTALAINLLVMGLAVMPLSRSVAGDEVRAQDAILALGDAHRLSRLAGETADSQVRAAEELSRFYAEVLPSSLAEARTLLYVDLASMAAASGVTHGAQAFEPEEVEDSSLIRYRSDATLSGEYAGIRQFLYRLDTAEKFFVVESVKLGQSGQQEGSGGPIEVVLQIATYYSRSAGPGGRE